MPGPLNAVLVGTEISHTERQPDISPSTFDRFAQKIVDEQRRRKERRRHDLEYKWKEVDRQIAMEYNVRYDVDGEPSTGTSSNWMPELELPLQAEALEVLCTDARRMMFDDAEDWFIAHSALTDEYLERAESLTFIAGIKDEMQTAGVGRIRITQDAADKLVQAALNFYHRRYDFKARMDECNAEAFKYGTWAARGLLVKEDLTYDMTGLKPSKKKIPVFVPRSIKNLYLDDTPMQAMHEGLIVQPAHIYQYWQRVEDIKLAMVAGKESAGWIMDQTINLSPTGQDERHKDHVELLEWEGDFVEQDGTDVLYVPNIELTVAVNAGGPRIVRWRKRELPFRSYIVGHYQKDQIDSAYGTSPLMKGVPIQVATTEALNRTLQGGALDVQPPVAYDPNDWHLANAGGPRIEPNALWPAMSQVVPQKIGNPQALLAIYGMLLTQYQNQSGVTPVRMGESTQTHKSAFAVNVEETRGVVRTVDYVKTTLEGPLTSWLNMAYYMAKQALKKEPQVIFIDQYQGFVEIDSDHLPDHVVFDTAGADGPAEEMHKNQLFMTIVEGIAKLEPLVVQLGATPMDWDFVRKEALRRAGATDIGSYFKPRPAMVGQPAGQPQTLPGQSPPVPGAAPAPGPPAGAAPPLVSLPGGRR